MSGEPIDADAFDEFEAAGWEAQADAYHRFFAPITTRATAALLDATSIGSSTRVLDVATGPGYVAAAAIDREARVVGVDIAHEMLRVVRRLHPDIDVCRADAQRLPFEDASFDAVTGNFAVLHFARPERAAGEFARVLTPGGGVALSTWDRPDRCRLIGVFVDAVGRAGAVPPADLPVGPPFFRFSDDSEFIGLLAAAGLVDVDVQTLSFAHRFAAADDLWEGLLGGTVRTRALVLGQPADVRARIRQLFDELVADHLGDGGLEIAVSVKVASARKPERNA